MQCISFFFLWISDQTANMRLCPDIQSHNNNWQHSAEVQRPLSPLSILHQHSVIMQGEIHHELAKMPISPLTVDSNAQNAMWLHPSPFLEQRKPLLLLLHFCYHCCSVHPHVKYNPQPNTFEIQAESLCVVKHVGNRYQRGK